MLNSYIKPGLKIFFKLIICIFLSVITFFSFIFIFSQTATEKIGYKVFIYDEKEESYKYSYEHLFEDGVDVRLDALNDKKIDYQKVDVRSDFVGFEYYFTMTISQLFVLAAFVATLSGQMYRQGDSDRNKVSFNRMKPNIWYGFKVGMLTGGILMVVYILLLLSRFGIIADEFLGAFVFANYHLFFIIKLIIGSATLTSELSVLSLILCGLTVFVVPLSCELFYYLGYKQINLIEKIVYKKK